MRSSKHGNDSGQDRGPIAGPRGAGHGEGRESDHPEAERVEWPGKAVVQFGTVATFLHPHVRVRHVEIEQFAGRAFPRLQWGARDFGAELREIERVALKHHDGGIPRVRLVALDAAVVEHEIVVVVGLPGLPAIGDVGADLGGVAPIFHEDTAQRPVGATLAIVEDETIVERREGAFPDDMRQEVRPDLHDQVAQLPEAPRHNVKRHRSHEERHENGHDREGTQQSQRRDPGRAHDDQLAVAVELVQCVENRDEQRDGRYHHDEGGDAERRHTQEDDE